jgi:hypothetical protein
MVDQANTTSRPWRLFRNARPRNRSFPEIAMLSVFITQNTHHSAIQRLTCDPDRRQSPECPLARCRIMPRQPQRSPAVTATPPDILCRLGETSPDMKPPPPAPICPQAPDLSAKPFAPVPATARLNVVGTPRPRIASGLRYTRWHRI